jgi:hypothetical protein
LSQSWPGGAGAESVFNSRQTHHTHEGKAMKAVPALLAAATLAGLPAAASAQLVFGTADRSEPVYGIHLSTIRPTNQFPVPANIADSVTFPSLSGLSIWAMTANEPNRELYILDVGSLVPGGDPTSNLYRVKYDAPTPELVGVIRERTTNNGISLQGLAYDTQANRMFGVYNVGGTPGEGIYELDLAGQVGLNIFADKVLSVANLPGGETAWDFSDLDYDPVTNGLYGINDDSDAGAGLYRFDLTTNSASLVVASPDYRRLERDFDGLATGDGKAYFVTDEPGFIYVYDLVNGGPFTDFLAPTQTDSGLFAGAAYAPGLIPEPSSAGVVALLLGALRRRR